MIEKILSALKKSGAELYQITETARETAELYFIRKNLDMQRKNEIKQADVVVYKDFWEGEKHLLGSSTVVVQESQTEEEMAELFRGALYAAGFVKNAYYELYAGAKEEMAPATGDLAGKPLAEIVQLFSEALFAEDTRDDVFLNSAEIFAYRYVTRVMNSRGVDVKYQRSWVWGEFVAQCIGEQDVETYQDFKYEDLNADALRKKVRDILDMTCARAEAKAAPPAGEYRVILKGSYVKELLSYYSSRSNSAMIYPKYSTYAVGCEVQGEEVKKDRINLTLKATAPYSAEGIPMKDRVLVSDGKLQLIHGSNRFAYYLGIEPTGNYGAFAVPAGSVSLDEMKHAPYLEVVNFSDFQMDSYTGHFGGEIRLAFWYDGKKRIPVTGGSINGNILEAQKELAFSKEMQVDMDFEGPLAVCMEKINVAGA